jgi:hypothetical protein
MNLADDFKLLFLFLWRKGIEAALDGAIQFFQGNLNGVRLFQYLEHPAPGGAKGCP